MDAETFEGAIIDEATANDLVTAMEDEERTSWWLESFDRKLEKLVDHAHRWAHVYFLCAETGMGKTRACMVLLERHKAKGIYTKYVSFKGKKSAEAAVALASLARSVSRSSKLYPGKRTVVIDDFPATDECDLARQERSVSSIIKQGCAVIFCVHPECVQLAEEVSHVTLIQSGEFLLQGPSQDEGLAAMTRGIPLLMAACASIDQRKRTAQAVREALVYALEPFIKTHLRDTLPNDERALRLALFLLGRGALDEMPLVVGRLDTEVLSWLQVDAPVFGVDLQAERFDCAVVDDDEGLAFVLNGLSDTATAMPEVVFRCCRLLASTRRMHRCALVATLLDDEMRRAIVREWGVELVCWGEIALVQKVTSSDCWQDGQDAREIEVSTALSLVRDPIDPLERDLHFPTALTDQSIRGRRRRRYLELLGICRDLDCGMPRPRAALPAPEDDEYANAFVSHIEARSLLLEGRYAEAYHLLVNCPYRLEPTSLAGALLCDDLEMASLLSGEGPTEDECAAFKTARQYLRGLGVARLSAYRQMLEPSLNVVVGRETRIEGVESVIALADRMGDIAISGALLVAAGVADNRGRAYARAHVRSLRVAERLTGSQAKSLMKGAELVDALASYALGDEKPLHQFATADEDDIERDVASFFLPREVLGHEPAPSVLARTVCSGNASWELNVLCNDFGDQSVAFRRVIPKSWYAMSRRSVRKALSFARVGEREQLTLARGLPQQVAPEPPRDGARVVVTLLGGLSIKVDGKAVDLAPLERRRAKALLIYLAAKQGHRADRASVIDSIWPDNVGNGQQCLYGAVSATRRGLGIQKADRDVFENARESWTIGLNEPLFSIDVDHFEQAARDAIMYAGSDEDAIARACQAVELYTGDLCATSFDARGDIAARRQELCDLYGDVALVGAKAALREGRTSLAVRLSKLAYEACMLREDVVTIYIETLKSAGRYREAVGVYQNHAHLVVESTGLPPSIALREVMADVFPALSRANLDDVEEGVLAGALA